MEKPQALPLPRHAAARRPATNPAVTKKRYALPPKRRGEIAELAFMQKAVSLGFGVAKPYVDSESYDFILDSGERLWRVQVKSIYSPSRCGYRFMAWRSNHQPYSSEDIDFIVGYVVPRKVWYVVPVNHVAASAIVTALIYLTD